MQSYDKALFKWGWGKEKRRTEIPDLQTDSCNVAVWPGCLSAHTSAPGYQSHNTSLLKQLPSDTVPGKLSNQEEKSYIRYVHLYLTEEVWVKWKQIWGVQVKEIFHTHPMHVQVCIHTISVSQHWREEGKLYKLACIHYFLWKFIFAICSSLGEGWKSSMI